MLHSHWSGHLSCATFGAQCSPSSHRTQPPNERRRTDWGSGNWILPVLSSVLCMCGCVGPFYRAFYTTKASAFLQCTKPHIRTLLRLPLNSCSFFKGLSTLSAGTEVMHDCKTGLRYTALKWFILMFCQNSCASKWWVHQTPSVQSNTSTPVTRNHHEYKFMSILLKITLHIKLYIFLWKWSRALLFVID